jgi:hypothetical protein
MIDYDLLIFIILWAVASLPLVHSHNIWSILFSKYSILFYLFIFILNFSIFSLYFMLFNRLPACTFGFETSRPVQLTGDTLNSLTTAIIIVFRSRFWSNRAFTPLNTHPLVVSTELTRCCHAALIMSAIVHLWIIPFHFIYRFHIILYTIYTIYYACSVKMQWP